MKFNTNDYTTVEKEATATITEKKSRFIAAVTPVCTHDEAVSFIESVRAKNREASHNVYAYLCKDNNTQRYSDDGEPAGTAGMPVLDVLRKERLTDACVVVTRYFGGTLLGAGGLTRAYGRAAKEGVNAAGVVHMVFSEIFEVTADYSLLGKLQHEITSNFFLLLDTQFYENVILTVCAETRRSGELVERLTQAVNGRAKIRKTGERFTANPGKV